MRVNKSAIVGIRKLTARILVRISSDFVDRGHLSGCVIVQINHLCDVNVPIFSRNLVNLFI